jgi:cytochrome P450
VFDINRGRTEAQNLGFGYDIHSCLGAALARMESRIALEHLLDFVPEYTVDYDSLRRVSMTSVAGYANVRLRQLSSSELIERGRQIGQDPRRYVLR